MESRSSNAIQQLLSHIEEFTEEELVHLNRLIVERLRLMQQVKAHRAMTQFRVGQRVKFTTTAGQPVVGVLTKYNRKSVTVVTTDGHTWTVSPTFLQPA
jgi:predicted metal-dependent peptidase